jgi:hypothetical protein
MNKNSYYGNKNITTNQINSLPIVENLYSKDFDDEIAQEIKEELYFKNNAKFQENNCVCIRNIKKKQIS